MRNKIILWLLFTGLSLPAGAEPPASLDCVIEPYKLSEVSVGTTGVLASVAVAENETVSKGQLLAKLQSGVEEASVALAKMRADSKVNILEKQARYELSQRSQKRLEGLMTQNKMISELEVDEARTQTKVAKYELEKARVANKIEKLELDRAQEVLKRRSILSPLDGVVVEIFKSAGEYVDREPVVKLAQVDPLKVEVIAPVALFGTIKKGMQAEVRPEAPIGGQYSAEVTVVERLMDAASGTFGITLNLPNPAYRIPAGLRCEIEFSGNYRFSGN